MRQIPRRKHLQNTFEVTNAYKEVKDNKKPFQSFGGRTIGKRKRKVTAKTTQKGKQDTESKLAGEFESIIENTRNTNKYNMLIPE